MRKCKYGTCGSPRRRNPLGPPGPGTPGQLHRILFHRDDQQGLLLGEVQLFSDSQAPRYGVILGELAPVSLS